MKPLGWRLNANDFFYGKTLIDGRWCLAESFERIATKRRGRLYDRRVVEEQTGAKRPPRMR